MISLGKFKTMNITNIFSSFIFHEYLTVDLKKLTEFCYNEKKKSQGRIISNFGGWQSDDFNLHQLEFRELTDFINEQIKKLLPALGFKNNYVITNCWININGKNDFNKPHMHGGSVLAAVFYVTAPANAGRLVLRNPTQNHHFCIDAKIVDRWNELNSFTWEVEPEVGKLIIFPAWVDHYTLPNQSDEDRISLAFNISLYE